MEESTSTALYTGAFVLIFVSSLTISLFLFNSILDFSERAYEYNINMADNQTIVNVPVGAERLLSAEQVASYYYNYVSNDLYNGNKPNNSYTVKIYLDQSGKTELVANSTYTYKGIMDKLGNKTYILTYSKENTIIIKQATSAQINSML